MSIEICELTGGFLSEAVAVWNEVVEDGAAFPQDKPLDMSSGAEFFASQSFTGVAYDISSKEVMGIYISSTRITSGAAVIYVMQAMRSKGLIEVNI